MMQYVRPSVCLSHAPSSRTVFLPWYWLLENTNRKPLLEIGHEEVSDFQTISKFQDDMACHVCNMSATSTACRTRGI